MGVGEGIGSDGPGGRDWRREGERGKRRRERGEEEVRTGVLSEQTTAWFSLSFFPPFGVFGWVLFGYVLSLSLAFSLL